ncbi:MAG: 23S rRNA (guanosine(2251)-2'-O)-methyltransferase RlmB [bacterium]
MIYGKHSVEDFLQTGGEIIELFLLQGLKPQFTERWLLISEQKGFKVKLMRRRELDLLVGSSNHQGIAARVKLPPILDLDDWWSSLNSENVLVTVLDHIYDPQNLGAIIRSAEFFGTDGVGIPRRRSVSLTPAVIKASVGAVWRVSLVEVANIAETLRKLKRWGFWVYGLDSRGELNIWEVKWEKRTALVLGNESVGLGALTRKLCDDLVRIPGTGKIDSLNVSVATGVALGAYRKSRVFS